MRPLACIHLAALLLCACGQSTPPQPPSTLTQETASNAGSFLWHWDPVALNPPLNEEYDLLFALRRTDGTPLDIPVSNLRLDARMPRHGHGMNQDPLIERTGPGNYTARGLRLHMTGHWDIHLDVQQGALTERAEFSLELQ